LIETGRPLSVISEAAGYPVDVRCYSGFKANERPLSFSLHDRELSVMDIEGSWFEEDEGGCARRVCFRVRADDGDLYLLSCDETTGNWLLRRIWRLGGRA
jgi:hypothetical protein